MSPFILIMVAAGLFALGLMFTIAVAVWVPAAFLQRAARHGRFANLGSHDSHTPPARPIPASRALAGSGLRPV